MSKRSLQCPQEKYLIRSKGELLKRLWVPLLVAFFAAESRGEPLKDAQQIQRNRAVAARASTPVATPAIEIDVIEIEGVRSVPGADVEGALELTAGDVLDRSKLLQSVKNIQSLYQVRGYQDVKVMSELIKRRAEAEIEAPAPKAAAASVETVLRITVSEGLPTRVSGFDLQATNMRDSAFSSVWSRLREELIASAKLKAKDVFDQERIAEIKRSFEDTLLSQEFVGAKIDDIRISVAEAPPGLSASTDAAATDRAARWVRLDFQVDLGDRVTFGFRGNKRLTRNELMEIIKEQRSLGFAKDYVAVIGERIREKYQSLGYARVQVKHYTFEHPSRQERRVTYQIEEGPRVTIEGVDFDGNFVFQDEVLRQEFFAKAAQLTQRRIFVKKEVEAAAELLLEWVKSQGYLSSKLITISSSTISKGNAVRLLVYIYEGERTVVRNINLDGIRSFSAQEIRSMLSIEENQPLNLYAFSEGLEDLKSKYRGRGYWGMKLLNENSDNVVLYSQKNRIADVTLQVDEGPLYRASEIRIQGLSSTLPYVVRRELRFSEGDVLEEQKVIDSETRLRRLGLFTEVSIQLRDHPERVGFKDVRVILREANPGIVSGGIGVRNDLGVRVFGSIAYTSLWRRNHTWSLSGSVNRRFEDYCVTRSAETVCFAEYQFRMGYVWPWFLVDEMDFRPAITQEKRRFNQFDMQSTGFSATLERRILRYVPLYGGLTYTLERTIQFNAKNEIDNQALTIGGITPVIKLDYRDNPLAPTTGFYAQSSIELASAAFGSQSEPFPVGYTRVQFRGDQFIPIGRDITWYLSFRTGWERNNVSPDRPDGSFDPRVGIPLSKQFALGGAGSLRGFDLQELNFQDKAIRGTLSYVNYRTQIDLPLAGAMRFGPFLDAGNLLVDRYSFGNLRLGTGFGFHYQTPVGPVNFDWGFKINRQAGEDPHAFYFSVGVL